MYSSLARGESRVHGIKRNFALAHPSAWKVSSADTLTVCLLSLSRTQFQVSKRPPPASFLYQHLHQAFFPVICESFWSLLSLTDIILHTHLFYSSGSVDFVLLYSCILSVLSTAWHIGRCSINLLND